jgi:hypothetical protein
MLKQQTKKANKMNAKAKANTNDNDNNAKAKDWLKRVNKLSLSGRKLPELFSKLTYEIAVILSEDKTGGHYSKIGNLIKAAKDNKFNEREFIGYLGYVLSVTITKDKERMSGYATKKNGDLSLDAFVSWQEYKKNLRVIPIAVGDKEEEIKTENGELPKKLSSPDLPAEKASELINKLNEVKSQLEDEKNNKTTVEHMLEVSKRKEKSAYTAGYLARQNEYNIAVAGLEIENKRLREALEALESKLKSKVASKRAKA